MKYVLLDTAFKKTYGTLTMDRPVILQNNMRQCDVE